MKKYRLLLLLSALLFFLGACGDKKQETGSESKEVQFVNRRIAQLLVKQRRLRVRVIRKRKQRWILKQSLKGIIVA